MPSSCSSAHLSSSLLLPLALFLFASIALLANAQMTFSDGWGKRSSAATIPFALLASERHATKRQQQSRAVADLFVNNEDEAMNPAMEACHVGYAQRLVQLHEQMLALFSTYQQCQTKAAMMGGATAKKAVEKS